MARPELVPPPTAPARVGHIGIKVVHGGTFQIWQNPHSITAGVRMIDL